MKKQLLTALSIVLLTQPAYADQAFDSLVAERKALIQTILLGGADQSAVDRVKVLTEQIRMQTTLRIQQQVNQQTDLVRNMDRVDAQTQQVSNILFSGVTTPLQSGVVGNNPTTFPIPYPPQTVVSYSPPLGDELEKLVRIAVQKTPTAANGAVDKYSRPLQKFIAMTKESINFTIPYRGYGPSSEAASTILDEKQNLKSLSAAEYAQQRFMDETHLSMTLQVLQLAQGLGNSDLPRAEAAYKEIASMADTASADRLKALLDSQLTNSANPPAQLDILGRQAKYTTLLKAALEKDAVIKDIQAKLHKYTSHGKAASVTQQVVPALLGIASCVPNFVGPIARSMLGAFLIASGGPDAKRLMDELYLAERLQSRTEVLSQEIQLELSALDRNESPVLNYASQSLLEQ